MARLILLGHLSLPSVPKLHLCMNNEPYKKLYKWEVGKHLRNSFDKRNDLDHEVERHSGQCCLGSVTLPHPESGTAVLTISACS
jgi:hypothetical protein